MLAATYTGKAYRHLGSTAPAPKSTVAAATARAMETATAAKKSIIAHETAAAVETAKRLIPQDGDESADTRLLRVPALNFEALWVDTGKGESVIVPLLAVAGLEIGQSYPLDAALETLREAARPLVDMDDTMGA